MANATLQPPDELLKRFRTGGALRPDVEGWVVSWLDAAEDASAVYEAAPGKDRVLQAFQTLANSGADSAQQVNEGSEATQLLCVQPQQIGRFRIIKELGRGGMGIVYEAFDEQLNRRVAVKVMSPALAADRQARERFIREAQAAAGIVSDHVVQVYDVLEVDGVLLLVMELVDGMSLAQWRKDRPTPVTTTELLQVAREVLAGLKAAQHRKLIHRDLKPANILWDRVQGRFKVSDFGLARSLAGDESLTSFGGVVGTPAFMAPEQARGKPLDNRTDLFSVGVVLYWLVTGASPFQQGTTLATLDALATVDPPRLTGVPPEVGRFIARLLARDPAGRPADAATALAEARAIEAQVAGEVNPPRRRWGWGSIAAGCAGAAAVVLGIVLVIWDRNRGTLDIVDTDSGTKYLIDLGAISGARPRPAPAAIAADFRAGDRVELRVSTAGYADSSSESFRVVHAGDRGEVLEIVPGNTRCRVRLDRLGTEAVWILQEKLVRLPK